MTKDDVLFVEAGSRRGDIVKKGCSLKLKAAFPHGNGGSSPGQAHTSSRRT